MAALDTDTLAALAGYARSADTTATLVGSQRCEDYVVEDLRIASGDAEAVPVTLTRPPDADTPRPAVLYCHAHGKRHDIGRKELLDGRPALAAPPYGPLLAQCGYVTLCLEMAPFGARATTSEESLSKALLWHGRTLFGAMLSELSMGVDVLSQRADVDAGRIATLGLSMGGTHAYWLAALDPRVCAAAHLCCFASLGALVESGAHDLHGPYMTVPGLLRHGDMGDVADLVAPRPQLIGVGLEDALSPEPAFVAAHDQVRAAYRAAGAEDRLTTVIETASGHQETDAMRRAVLSFLYQWVAGMG